MHAWEWVNYSSYMHAYHDEITHARSLSCEMEVYKMWRKVNLKTKTSFLRRNLYFALRTSRQMHECYLQSILDPINLSTCYACQSVRIDLLIPQPISVECLWIFATAARTTRHLKSHLPTLISSSAQPKLPTRRLYILYKLYKLWGKPEE